MVIDEREVTRVRSLLGARGAGRGRGGFPEEARKAAAALAYRARATGHAVGPLATRLGVHVVTLTAWMRAYSESALMPFVAVACPAPPRAAARIDGLTVYHPSGVRVEGMDVDGVVHLIRALSCRS